MEKMLIPKADYEMLLSRFDKDNFEKSDSGKSWMNRTPCPFCQRHRNDEGWYECDECEVYAYFKRYCMALLEDECGREPGVIELHPKEVFVLRRSPEEEKEVWQ